MNGCIGTIDLIAPPLIMLSPPLTFSIILVKLLFIVINVSLVVIVFIIMET